MIMKTCLILFVGVLFISSSISAQYKINKTKYNFMDYTHQVGDPYNPSVAGVCSFFVPGLGQMVSGEFLRGIAYLGGAIGCGILAGTGAGQSTTDLFLEGGDGTSGSGLFLIGVAGLIVIDIWSIVDAVRVAKVNNLAWRDKSKTGYNLQLNPVALPVAGNFPAGMTLKVIF